MRIKLLIKTESSKELSLNYNYPLSAAIYKLLHFGSNEFSTFLHDIGFVTKGKTYKLFSFALRFEKPPRILNNRFYLKSDYLSLFISSPLVDKFVNSFLLGSFKNQGIELISQNIKTTFFIEQIEVIPEPSFSSNMNFSLLSPLVISTKKESNGKLIPKYFRYFDNINDITRVFNSNLINKYKLVTGKDFCGDKLIFNWDTEYIERRLERNKRVTKLISSLIDGNIINIKAIEIPFSLKGSTELMKVGYECGFGSQNSLGFGLAKVAE